MFIEILKAILLGIVEGVTEFLPISSTGHLILVNQFVSFNFAGLSSAAIVKFTNMFDVVIQFGAILAVVFYFWNKLWPFGKHKSPVQKAKTWDIWKKTIIGFLPAIVLGALFDKKIEQYLYFPVPIAIALVVGGILLIAIESRKKRGGVPSVSAMNTRTAVFIGLIQCIAMIPGTSRSAATIIGAMLLGLSRVAAAEYSFFLAIPTIFGASVFKLKEVGLSMTGEQAVVLAVGFVVSFIVALGVVAVFMKYISRHDFKPFGWYRIALGALILAVFLIKW